MTGRKARLGYWGRLGYKEVGSYQTWPPPFLHIWEVSGVHLLGVKSGEDMCATRGHGGYLSYMDAEPRKHGDRSVFDTLVVHAVNDGCWAGLISALAYAKHPAWEKAARQGT